MFGQVNENAQHSNYGIIKHLIIPNVIKSSKRLFGIYLCII